MASAEDAMEDLRTVTPTELGFNATDTQEASTAIDVNLYMYLANFVLVMTINPVCLLVIQRMANMQPTSKNFMSSLLVCKIGYGIFVLIPFMLSTLFPFQDSSIWWNFTIMCIVIFTVQSFLSLLILTIDRYLAIAWALHYPRLITIRSSKIIISISWALSLVWGLINVFLISTSVDVFIIQGYVLIATLVIGVTSIVTLYLHILVIARRQARRIARDNQAGAGNNAPQRVSTKSFTTIFIIISVILLCWIPGCVCTVLLTSGTYVLPEIFFLTSVLFIATNWIDAVIFCARNKEFRETLRKQTLTCFRGLVQKLNCN